MHSLVHAWARDRFNSEEKKAQAWRATESILSLALSVEKPEIQLLYRRQLRPHVHLYISLNIPESNPSDYLEVIVPILLISAEFLGNIRDNKILANWLKQTFENLRIDSKFLSTELIHLLSLYNLQVQNFQGMGYNKDLVQLLEIIVKI